METRPRIIEIFGDENGRSPFDDWTSELASSNKNLLAIIDSRIGRIRRGLLGDCEPVGEGVSELKIDVGPGYRIYFGCRRDMVVILLAGTKKTQKQDIKKAKKFWRKDNA